MKKIILPILISMAFFNACKREVIPADNIELGKDYYPLTEGHFVEYNVDSIIYNDFTKTIDTVHLQYRDEVGASFVDDQGRDSYLIQRSKRYDSTQAWQENLTYYATETNFNLEVIENNLRFMKLVFPVKVNTRWKGNKYIPAASNDEIKWYNDWDYRYTNINETYNNGIVSFPNSVVVTEANLPEGNASDPTSYSALTYSLEAYSKNVGLIYREVTRWEYQNAASQPFRNGFTVIFRATKHN